MLLSQFLSWHISERWEGASHRLRRIYCGRKVSIAICQSLTQSELFYQSVNRNLFTLKRFNFPSKGWDPSTELVRGVGTSFWLEKYLTKVLGEGGNGEMSVQKILVLKFFLLGSALWLITSNQFIASFQQINVQVPRFTLVEKWVCTKFNLLVK